jgi:hypothetical protein
MKAPEEIRAYIKRTVSEQLPQVEPAGLREWVAARVVDPYAVRMAVDPEGKQIEDLWVVTDHKDGPHYRIAFFPQDEAFGIVIPMASGDYYMGDCGNFKQAVEAL